VANDRFEPLLLDYADAAFRLCSNSKTEISAQSGRSAPSRAAVQLHRSGKSSALQQVWQINAEISVKVAMVKASSAERRECSVEITALANFAASFYPQTVMHMKNGAAAHDLVKPSRRVTTRRND
tara:strand:- start:189 stop:563 length:375 start_codon:yes stop_codon:yes gene_type:complete